jgi:O-glycosyl hydrolase
MKIVAVLLAMLLINATLFAQSITFTINLKKKAQTMENIGASGAWFSEGIGKYWPAGKKERMAELLFSKGFDAAGNPLGIGLSAWRFNAGGGTTEQGDNSGIKTAVKRVESFLAPDGTYDWNKQQGYIWFTKKAAQYGVENLILFSNTPPVQFTKNGLGFKTEKDYQTNLREDKYGDYAAFLATIVQHFDSAGLHFNYISPVNEPQWDWSNKFGQMNQEGSPWLNKDIYHVAASLDSVLAARKMNAQFFITEAGILTALYEGSGHASRQIQNFFAPSSNYNVRNLSHLKPVIAGHSYFTDAVDTTIVTVRQKLKDTAAKYSIPFWQSEYSMLGDGYKEGKKGRIPAIDCALFLAKMIHHDFAVANATAWHLWNSWEPGNAELDTRYYLLALKSNPENTQGDFTITKNLWALGHYSRFIRPGMQRLHVERSDSLNDLQAAQNMMLSAYSNDTATVVVAINYTGVEKTIDLNLPELKKWKSLQLFVTSADANDNMKPYPLTTIKKVVMKPRSIATIVIKR